MTPELEIVSRSEWEARAPKYRYTMPVPTPELWLHHSAGAGSDERAVRAIQDYHMEPEPDGRGWSDIAYSFLIDDDDDPEIFEGRGVGIVGGHTKDHNSISHAICVIGNFERELPKGETLDMLVSLAAAGYLLGWWRLGFSGGHRDARRRDGSLPGTACPGTALYGIIPDLNRAIERTAREAAEMLFKDIAHLPATVQDDIEWAAERKITYGTSEETFSPDVAVSRAQFVTMLRRCVRLVSPALAERKA